VVEVAHTPKPVATKAVAATANELILRIWGLRVYRNELIAAPQRILLQCTISLLHLCRKLRRGGFIVHWECCREQVKSMAKHRKTGIELSALPPKADIRFQSSINNTVDSLIGFSRRSRGRLVRPAAYEETASSTTS